MTVAATRSRVRADIVRAAHRGLGVREYSRVVTRTLGRVVPFEGTCLLTTDPATLLPTGEVVENGLPPDARARLAEIEVGEPDVNKFVALAHAGSPAASLSEATGGDLDRSLRQRELRRPLGFADELRMVLSDDSGCWGTLTLLREADSPHFTPADVRFVASLTGPIAEGLKRAILLGDAAKGGGEGEPGLLMLAADDSAQMANRPAERWLDEMTAGQPSGTNHLPVVVHAVAARVRNVAAGGGPTDRPARARVRTPAGEWFVVSGSLLGDGPDARVAILIEAAGSPELAPLIADAYGLTERERSITELVAHGLSTSEIATRLYLSAYTVQDHLKAIFDKTGSSSRGQLVARLFFEHYAPRLSAAEPPDVPAA